MAISSTAALWFLPLVSLICLFTFYVDMKSKKISNMTVWALFIAYVAVGIFVLPFDDFLWRFANYAVVFAIGLGMWTLGGVGAGDVKFVSVMALFIDKQDAPLMIRIAVAAMLAAAIAVFIVRLTPLHRLAPDWAAWRTKDANSVGEGKKAAVPMGTGLGLMLCSYLALGVVYGQ